MVGYLEIHANLLGSMPPCSVSRACASTANTLPGKQAAQAWAQLTPASCHDRRLLKSRTGSCITHVRFDSTRPSISPPAFTAGVTRSISIGDGWINSSNAAGGIDTIAGCTYTNAWTAVSFAIPTVYVGILVLEPRAATAPTPTHA